MGDHARYGVNQRRAGEVPRGARAVKLHGRPYQIVLAAHAQPEVAVLTAEVRAPVRGVRRRTPMLLGLA